MRKEVVAEGATVEEALEKARAMLGVAVDDTDIEVHEEILEMPQKKTFGLFGGRPAKVRAYIEEDEPAPAPAPKPAAEKPAPAPAVKEQPKEKAAAPAPVPAPTPAAPKDGPDPAQAAADYLKTVLEKMGLPDVQVTIFREEGGAALSLSGEDVSSIIGHRGETLDSLQYLASLVANHVEESYYRITLDVGNYRQKRKETLEALGRRMAQRAVRSGRNSSLEPMNPYERRIIHTAVQTVAGAKSWSEGSDLNRHVVIGPEGGERARRDGDRRGGRSRNDRRGGRSGGGSRSGNRGGSRSGSSAPRPEGPKSDAPDMPIYGKIEARKPEE